MANTFLEQRKAQRAIMARIIFGKPRSDSLLPRNEAATGGTLR